MASPNAAAAAPEKRFQWLTYNETRARVMVLRGSIGATSKTLSPGPSFSLMPGAQVVDARLWGEWKKQNADRSEGDEKIPGQATALLKGVVPTDDHRHRHVDGAGRPFIVEGPPVARADSPLSDLDEAQALAVIPEILDLALMKRLIQIERRSAVSEALRARIDKYERGLNAPTI